MKSMIQRSDPFRIEKCDRQSCMVCQTSRKGSCDKEGVTYSIRCVECTERGIEKSITENHPGMLIHGETVMYRNFRFGHDSEIQNFTMSVTGMYKDVMLRHVSQAVALGNAKVGTKH